MDQLRLQSQISREPKPLISGNNLRHPGLGLFQQLSIKATMSSVTRPHFNLMQNERDGCSYCCWLGCVSEESRLVRFFAWPVWMCASVSVYMTSNVKVNIYSFAPDLYFLFDFSLIGISSCSPVKLLLKIQTHMNWRWSRSERQVERRWEPSWHL